jgi:homogentisate 1,2-dioxygenase
MHQRPTFNQCVFTKGPWVYLLKSAFGLGAHIFSAFMFETSMMLTITDFALNRSGKLHGKCQIAKFIWTSNHLDSFPEHEPKMWDNLKAQFMDHLDEINADLKAAGLPALGAQ